MPLRTQDPFAFQLGIVLLCAGMMMIRPAEALAERSPDLAPGELRVHTPFPQTIKTGENVSVSVSIDDNAATQRLQFAIDGHRRYGATVETGVGHAGEPIDVEIRTVAVSGDYLGAGRYGVTLRATGRGTPPLRLGELIVESVAGETGLAAKVGAHRRYLADNADSPAAGIASTDRAGSAQALPDADAPLVPEPFEPVRLSGRSLAVVGRSILLGANGLPARIESAGQIVVREPITWATDAAGSEIREPTYFTHVSGDRVAWSATESVAGLQVKTAGSLEYDGFLRFAITLSPVVGGQPGRLMLRLPLSSQQAEYVTWLGGGALPSDKRAPGWSLASAYDGRAIGQGCESLPFSFQYLVSGHAAGLLFAIESDRDWPLADRRSHVRLCRRDRHVELEVLVVDDAVGVDRPVSIEFALQALPARPLPDDRRMQQFNPAQFPDATLAYRRELWRAGSARSSLRFAERPELAGQLSAWDSAVADGLRTVVVHQGWTEIQGYPGTLEHGRLAALRRLTDDAHEAGLKVLAYVGLELSEAAPEWPRMAGRIATLPLRFGRSRGDVRAVRPSGGSPEYARFLLEHLQTLQQQAGIDGVFLDLVPEPQVSVNERAGMGYRTGEGGYRGTLPAFGNRELLKSIYRLFHSAPGEPGIVACHAGGPHRPGHGFCDYILAGETEIADARRHGHDRLIDSLPLERFRALYSPWLRGVPVVWLSKPQRGGASMSANAAVTLLHGVPQRAQWPHFIPADAGLSMLNPPRDVATQWQVWRDGSVTDFRKGRHYPYWSSAELIDGLPDDVHASFRVYAEPPRIEAVVSNLGHAAREFDMTFLPAEAALHGPPQEARDRLSGEPLPIRAGAIRLAIKGDCFRIIEIGYRDR